MKVYLLASPRSVGERPEFFARVYANLRKNHQMVDTLVGRLCRMKNIEDFYKATKKEKTDRFERWMGFVNKCDVVVVEVSGHSMTLGYVIGKALEQNKPVVALYEKDKESYFVSGISSAKIQVVEYGEENVLELIEEAIERARKMIDVRFNFFVSPRILTYLDWVATRRKVPRSVFLRNLIEKQMRKEKEFK